MKTKTETTAKSILAGTLVAGTLDILGAITVWQFILQKTTAQRVLQAIASGVFGPAAFKGGWIMALAGLGFHFLITFIFVVLYFWLGQFITVTTTNAVVSGFLYGIIVWAIMTFAVVPMSHVQSRPFAFNAAVWLILACHLFFVGLPIALIAKKYFHNYRT